MTKPISRVIEEVYTKDNFTFAKVVDTTTGKTLTGIGFAKWDNDNGMPYSEQMGRDIAVGRAKKEIKKQLKAMPVRKTRTRKTNTEKKVDLTA